MNHPKLASALVALGFAVIACGCDSGDEPFVDAAVQPGVDTGAADTAKQPDAAAGKDTASAPDSAADTAVADASADTAAVDAAPDVAGADAAPDVAADLAPDVAVDAAAADVAIDAAVVDANDSDAVADAAVIDANTDPTFSNIFTSIVVPRCNSCHGKIPPIGMSNLQMMTKDEAYANLVNVMAAGVACGPNRGAIDAGAGDGGTDGGDGDGGTDAGVDASPPVDAGPLPIRVVPGDSSKSLLYQKVALANPSCGKRMPLSQLPLSAFQIDLIKSWIDKGAPND